MNAIFICINIIYAVVQLPLVSGWIYESFGFQMFQRKNQTQNQRKKFLGFDHCYLKSNATIFIRTHPNQPNFRWGYLKKNIKVLTAGGFENGDFAKCFLRFVHKIRMNWLGFISNQRLFSLIMTLKWLACMILPLWMKDRITLEGFRLNSTKKNCSKF